MKKSGHTEYNIIWSEHSVKTTQHKDKTINNNDIIIDFNDVKIGYTAKSTEQKCIATDHNAAITTEHGVST